VCEIGLARFSKEARRTRLVQQIEKRGQRCRAKHRVMDEAAADIAQPLQGSR
jgi:hypothetical protein